MIGCVFAFQAGTAEAFVPVIEALQGCTEIKVFSGPTAAPIFAREHVEHTIVEDAREITAWMEQETRGLDWILTGTSWVPELEAAVWSKARSLEVCSVAFVDNWGGYRDRFRSALETRSMPDAIAAVDDAMRLELLEALGPATAISVVGHPALEQLTHSSSNRDESFRRELGIAPEEMLILWVADGIYRNPPAGFPTPESLGYSDEEMLSKLTDCLNAMGQSRRFHLLLRHHPASPDPALALGLRAGAHFPWQVCDAMPKLRLILASDIVIGGSSMILLEAALLQRLAVSCLREKAEAFPLLDRNRDLIPLFGSCDELETLLLQHPKTHPVSGRFGQDTVGNIVRLLSNA